MGKKNKNASKASVGKKSKSVSKLSSSKSKSRKQLSKDLLSKRPKTEGGKPSSRSGTRNSKRPKSHGKSDDTKELKSFFNPDPSNPLVIRSASLPPPGSRKPWAPKVDATTTMTTAVPMSSLTARNQEYLPPNNSLAEMKKAPKPKVADLKPKSKPSEAKSKKSLRKTKSSVTSKEQLKELRKAELKKSKIEARRLVSSFKRLQAIQDRSSRAAAVTPSKLRGKSLVKTQMTQQVKSMVFQPKTRSLPATSLSRMTTHGKRSRYSVQEAAARLSFPWPTKSVYEAEMIEDNKRVSVMEREDTLREIRKFFDLYPELLKMPGMRAIWEESNRPLGLTTVAGKKSSGRVHTNEIQAELDGNLEVILDSLRRVFGRNNAAKDKLKEYKPMTVPNWGHVETGWPGFGMKPKDNWKDYASPSRLLSQKENPKGSKGILKQTKSNTRDNASVASKDKDKKSKGIKAKGSKSQSCPSGSKGSCKVVMKRPRAVQQI